MVVSALSSMSRMRRAGEAGWSGRRTGGDSLASSEVATGSLTRKLLPKPTPSLLTLICPPCSSVMALATDKPIPRPPTELFCLKHIQTDEDDEMKCVKLRG